MQVVEKKGWTVRERFAIYYMDEIHASCGPRWLKARLPKFHDIQRDILALNPVTGRSVTPSLKPGELRGRGIVSPVKDTLRTLLGSVEPNNRTARIRCHADKILMSYNTSGNSQINRREFRWPQSAPTMRRSYQDC